MKLVISAEIVLSDKWLDTICEMSAKLLSMIKIVEDKHFPLNDSILSELSINLSSEDDVYLIFNENKSKLTILIGKSGSAIFEEPEFISSLYKTLTHKIVYVPTIFGLAFLDFITSNAKTIINNNIDSCVLLWPNSYTEMISEKLNVSPRWTEKLIKEIFICSVDKDYNPKVTTKLVLYFTLQAYVMPLLIRIGHESPVLFNLINFLSDRFNSFSKQLLLNEEETEALSKIKFSYHKMNDNYSCEYLLKEPFYFFLEDTSSYLDKILLENKKVVGLSVDSNETYTWDRIFVWDRLSKILSSENDNKPLVNNYRINFIESLDKKLYASISQMLNDETPNNYLYVICEDDFVKRKIVKYIDNCFSSDNDINHLYCTSSDRPKIINHKLMFVHEFTELNKKEQFNTWEYLFNSSDKNIKVIFFDKILFSNPRIDLESRKVWYYKEEMLENNLSKIYHSILDDNNNVKVNDEIITAINNNSFIDLIKSDYFKYNLKLLSDTLSIVNLRRFDYRTVSSWYNYRQLYENESIKQYDSKAESDKMMQTKKIIFTKVDGKNLEIVIDGEYVSEKYRKTMMYLILAIDYWQEKGKYIGTVHLTEIIDYYFNQKNIEKKLEASNANGIAHKILKSAFSTKGAKNLHNKTKKFINEHINIKLGKIEYYDYDPENEHCKYLVEFKGLNLDKRLYDNNYRDLLNQIATKIRRY